MMRLKRWTVYVPLEYGQYCRMRDQGLPVFLDVQGGAWGEQIGYRHWTREAAVADAAQYNVLTAKLTRMQVRIRALASGSLHTTASVEMREAYAGRINRSGWWG